jgi:hypothetical protein
MVSRIKTALVESFVGAIALGWIFAQAAMHFAYIFIAPFTGWIQRQQYREYSTSMSVTRPLSLWDSGPEFARFAALTVVGLLLLRWLYGSPKGSAVVPIETNIENQPG